VGYVKTKNEPTVVRQNNDPRQGATSHKTITSNMQFSTKCCFSACVLRTDSPSSRGIYSERKNTASEERPTYQSFVHLPTDAQVNVLKTI